MCEIVKDIDDYVKPCVEPIMTGTIKCKNGVQINEILKSFNHSVKGGRHNTGCPIPSLPASAQIFRSASSSRNRSVEKKIRKKVSNCNNLLSPAYTYTLVQDSYR